MTGGLIALAVAVTAATMLGFALRRSSGRFRAGQEAADDATPEFPGPPAGQPLGGRQRCRLVDAPAPAAR